MESGSEIIQDKRSNVTLMQATASGCLGVFFIILIMPVVGGLSIYQWFASLPCNITVIY